MTFFIIQTIVRHKLAFQKNKIKTLPQNAFQFPFGLFLAILRASFTKQDKLMRERNSKTAPMGVEISAGDLLTTRKLKNRRNISFTYRPTQNTKRSTN